MEFDFQRIDLIPPADVERSAGSAALVVRQHLERTSASASTYLLGKKAFRWALARLPPGHLLLELAEEDLGPGRWERAARAHARIRACSDMVPDLSLSTARCLVWSSAVWRPRKLSVPGLAMVVEAAREDLPLAVAELWAAVFLEPVLERVPSGLRRLELAVGVTEDVPDARAALLAALAERTDAPSSTLPPPGQAGWSSPAVAFDRSVERARMTARRVVLRRAFGAPAITLASGPWGPGLDVDQCRLLAMRQGGNISAAVCRDTIGPVEPAPDVGMRGERAIDLARLAGQLAVHVAQMAELARDVEQVTLRAEARHDWMAEMDLALLPDDGLRTTLETQLGLLSSVTDLAMRSALASARISRTFSALSGITLGDLDLGVAYPIIDLLLDFELGSARVRDAARADGALEGEVDAFAGRHAQVFPVFDEPARASLRRAFEQASLRERPPLGVQRQLELARVRGDEAAAGFESHLPRALAARLSPLRSVVEEASLLRERARMLEVLADALLRRVALEVDRRLPRLEPGLPVGAVWYCHLEEILQTVDLRGMSLQARVHARSLDEAAYQAAARASPPPVFGARQLLAPIPLARARGLDQVPGLLAMPEQVSYGGRASDTLVCLARALDLPWGHRMGGAHPPE